MRRLSLSLVFLAFGFGCGDDGDSRATGVPPATTAPAISSGADTTTSQAGSTTGTAELACCGDLADPDQPRTCDLCASELFCAAVRELGREPEASEYTCQSECLVTGLAGLYCGDSSACCDPAAYCEQATGYCRVDVIASTGVASTGSGTDTGSSSHGTDTDETGTGTSTTTN